MLCKIAWVRWHKGGSIILLNVFAYFLGNAKSMSPAGLRAKEKNSLHIIKLSLVKSEHQDRMK